MHTPTTGPRDFRLWADSARLALMRDGEPTKGKQVDPRRIARGRGSLSGSRVRRSSKKGCRMMNQGHHVWTLSGWGLVAAA
jgi:hypothetical protein